MKCVSLKQELRFDAEFLRSRDQADMNGVSEALRRTHAEIASRYGRMTFQTRQMRADFSTSASVNLRPRQPSFSASSATSIPILLRNLKQSATVLATS
jgi:hypothetical protein